MKTIRQVTVDHKDWVNKADALHGKHLPDPKPGEEDLVCSRCHSVSILPNGQVLLEVVYEEPAPIVITAPPLG